MPDIAVAAVQFRLKRYRRPAAFWEDIRRHVEEAARCDAQLVVFPEYVTAQLLAQTAPMDNGEACEFLHGRTDEVLSTFTSLSRAFGVVILGGTHVHRENGRYYNEAFLFFPDGRIGRQKKLHLTPEERNEWPLSPGDGLTVFDTPVGPVGIAICYDVEFPEVGRLLADAGAEWLLCPSFTETKAGYYRVRVCCRARATENQMYAVMSGLVGRLPDVPQIEAAYSRAAVFAPCDEPFPPDGILAQGRPNTGDTIVCSVAVDRLALNRTAGRVAPFFDRKTDRYAGWTPGRFT